MQITKELLDGEIVTLQFRLKDQEASANKLAGALVVLQDLRRYLDREEEKEKADAEAAAKAIAEAEAAKNYISEENAAIQKRDEDRALSMKQLAEIVAGPGAVAEEPQPFYDEKYDEYDDYNEWSAD